MADTVKPKTTGEALVFCQISRCRVSAVTHKTRVLPKTPRSYENVNAQWRDAFLFALNNKRTNTGVLFF